MTGYCRRKAESAAARSTSGISALLPTVKIAHRHRLTGKLVVAQDHRRAGIDLVGALHPLAHVAAVGHVDRKPVAAQAVTKGERFALRRLAQRDNRNGAGCRRRVFEQHGKPLDPARPTDTRRRRPAQLLDQTIITPAGQHGALCAERLGGELERGVGVIVEPAHQARDLRCRGFRARRALRKPRRKTPPIPHSDGRS